VDDLSAFPFGALESVAHELGVLRAERASLSTGEAGAPGRRRRAGLEEQVMRRNVFTLGIAAALAVAAAGPAWADLPFGFFDGKQGGGNGAAGVVGLIGWALDDNGVEAVDIYVDGVLAGRTLYGFNRPGVGDMFPGFPDGDNAGWVFSLNTTRYTNGLHTVTPRAISAVGEVRDLNSRVFEVLNTTHNLVPFGAIDQPRANAELFGTCDPLAVNRRLTVVSGWALDVGVEQNDTGVGYVELLIDGTIFANTRTDCFFEPALGGFTQCYGLRRFDIDRSFPDVRDAPHAGFRFVLDIGALIEFGYVEGFHVLSIRSGDVNANSSEFAEVPVTFLCDDHVGNEGSFGQIDLPPDGLLFTGVVTFSGWALDFEGVSRVRIFVDGFEVGDAAYGLPRPVVSAAFPGFPDTAAPGWSFTLDTTTLSEGEHQFQVFVIDDAGFATLIGEREFNVENP